MNRFIKSILLSLGILAGCSKSDVLDPADFSKEFAGALRKSYPDLKVQIVRDLQLKLTTVDGKDSTFFLDNAYGLYKQDTKSKEEIIRKYVASCSDTLTAKTVDRSLIVPIIKDRPWLAEMRKSVLARSGTTMAENVYEDLNPDLIIVYAEDSPKNIRYLSAEDLKLLHLERKDLRNLACENLKRLLPKIQRGIDDGFYQLSAGGDYDASLLLLDSVWDRIKPDVHGDIVIAIPARNGLLVTGSEDEKGIVHVRELVQKVYAENPYRLTTRLFVRHNGKFEEFKQ